MNWRLQIVSIMIRRLTVFSLAESLHLMGARSYKVRKKIAKGKKRFTLTFCSLAHSDWLVKRSSSFLVALFISFTVWLHFSRL